MQFCEQVFDNRYKFMHHRKLEHEQTVPHCKKASSWTCWFGSRKCWFLHEKDTLNQNGNEEKLNGKKYNEEVIQKIFDMMETFTTRIV